MHRDSRADGRAAECSQAVLVRRTVLRVIAVVRVVRVLLILVLGCLAISFVMAIGTGGTGILEKVVLLVLIAGCVYAAAKVTILSEKAVRRLEHR